MAWWTSVAGLTPVAAFDASRISGAQLLDGVGDNHITATSTLMPNDFQLKGVAGNGNPMALTTPIPMPANGVVAALWSPKRRNVLLTPGYDITSGYALHLSDNGQGWYAANNGASSPYGGYGGIGMSYFVAMVMRGSDSILYVDGNLVGVPVSSGYTMPQIGQVGYGANGNEYNLDADEFFHGLGTARSATTFQASSALPSRRKAANWCACSNAANSPTPIRSTVEARNDQTHQPAPRHKDRSGLTPDLHLREYFCNW
jgi:hypothetical protein